MGAKLNLNLDKVTASKPVAVFHSIHYKGNRFRISTGQAIDPIYWDKDKQQVKRKRENYKYFNDLFKKQVNDIERIILKLEQTGRQINKEIIVAQLEWNHSIEAKEVKPIPLFEKFINDYGSDRAPRTVKGYTTTLAYLKKYVNSLSENISFNDFSESFYKRFRDFLGMYDNSFGFYIKNLKIFLNWAKEKGYHDNDTFRKWKIPNEDGKDHFFLKYDEILLLSKIDFEPRLQKVIDLFLIGCYCGLRYSDLVSLNPIHVQNGMITKVAVKTNQYLKIPVIPELQQLFSKYWQNKMSLPQISNQKGNEYLKEAAKLAGINRQFNYIQKKNKKAEETTYEAWQMMSWHVARHSFITNCIQLGVPIEVVRRIVGHTSFQTMKKYIQNDDEFNKIEMMKLSRMRINKAL